MSASAQLVERHAGVVDLAVRNNPSYVSFRLGGAVSLDAAFAGTTQMVDVLVGRDFRSRTLRKNRINWVEERNRSLTRITVDPNDYASATIPGDGTIAFYRVQGIDSTGTAAPEGPILVVPPPGFFVSGRRDLILNGTAPSVAGLANNQPPPGAMQVDLPEFADRIIIYNDGGAPLFVSLGAGTQELEIANGESHTFVQAGASLLSLRGDGGTAVFRAVCSLINGIQG